MVRTSVRYFLKCRPKWQRDSWQPELEGVSYLALCRAAKTYDPARLPYPKRYFALAILNAMLKAVKQLARTPGEQVGLDVAQPEAREEDRLDHIGEAIAGLPARDRAMAKMRLLKKKRISDLAGRFKMDMRRASIAADRVARTVAGRLGIHVERRTQAQRCRSGCSERPSPAPTTSSPAATPCPATAGSRSSAKTSRSPARPAPSRPRPAPQGKGRKPSPKPSTRKAAGSRASRGTGGKRSTPSSAKKSSPAQTQRTQPAGGRTSGRRA